jgi:hypothetical protein
MNFLHRTQPKPAAVSLHYHLHDHSKIPASIFVLIALISAVVL